MPIAGTHGVSGSCYYAIYSVPRLYAVSLATSALTPVRGELPVQIRTHR